MSTLQDKALTQEQVGVTDKALPSPGDVVRNIPEDDALAGNRIAQAAVMRSAITDLSVLEAAQELVVQGRQSSGDAVRREEATRMDMQDQEDARELFYRAAVSTGVDATTALAGVNQAELEADRERSKESWPIDRYVAAIAHPEHMSDEDKEALATNLYLKDKLQEFTQNISGWEIAGDLIASVAIGPKDLWDAMQATGKWSPKEQAEVYQKLGAWFQELPPEEQRRVFEPLLKWTTDAMPRARAAEFVRGIIDPAAAEGVSDELNIFGTIDAALLGAGAVGAAFKLRKLYNPIKSAAGAGALDEAAEVNLGVMERGEIAAALDIDEWVANSNALPFYGEILDDAVDGAISPAVHERIYQFRDRLKAAFTDLAEAKSFTREGFLDTEDAEKASRRLHDEYETYVRENYAGKDKIIDLESTEPTSDGVTFKFSVTNPDGTVVKDEYTGAFSFDDIGFWQAAPRSSAIWSSKQQARKTDFASTVNAAIRLDNTAAAVATQLRKVVKDASKPIRGFKGKPRKQRVDEVDQVLISGDDMTKEYTPQELKAGVNGVKLDEDQIEYYYNMRGVMNGLGILRNMDARRAMDARGVKQININDQTRFFGEVIDDSATAARRLRDVRKVWVFDEVGAPKDVRDLNLTQMYEDGFRLSRLEEDTVLGGARYQHVLVKTDTVSELPGLVLDLKKGYIPRVNPKATYFVHALTPSSLDGAEDMTRKAVRSFDNEKEANEFASQMFARMEEEGFEAGTTFRVFEDGELEAFKAGESGMTQTGGLVYSPRARTPVPHNDGDATTVPRTSALEAVELYLENTKNYMTRNDWRMGLRRKWENTARFKLQKAVSFDEGENIADNDLRRMWEKITEYSGFMDKSERSWEQTVKGVYEWSIEKYGRNRISDFILTQRQKDPLARLRAATFHTLLGFFNPVQLWVQAQGAAVAMSINLDNPGRLIKAFRMQNHLALTQHVHFDDSDKISRQMAKAAGYESVDEMKAMRELWQKSGFYDSTLSSADVEAAARGFPTTRNAVSRFFDSGLLFFRAGELFNRRLAFLTAIDELGGAQKLRSSDKLFKEALDRTNNLILNLGKANRAQWQKGALSIPTQFMQIQAKTLETILGMNGALTGWERGKLMLGQMTLYGSAGVLGGHFAMNQAASLMGVDRIDVNNMDTATLRAFTGGFTDWFAYQMGANIIASDRGALLNGMDQTIFSLFTEEMSAWEWLMGPTSVGPTRVFTKLRQLATMFPEPQDINGEVSFNATDVTDTMQFIAKGMGSLAVSPFASTNQVNKWLLMRDLGIIRDKNGNVVAAPQEGFNPMTEWAALIGFKPELLQRKFDLSEINEETRKYVEFRSNLLLMNWDEFMMEYERARHENRDMDEDTLRMFRKRQNVLLNSIPEPGVRKRVLESYQNRLRRRTKDGNSQLDRQMQRYYENMLLDVAGAFTSSDTRLIQTRDSE